MSTNLGPVIRQGWARLTHDVANLATVLGNHVGASTVAVLVLAAVVLISYAAVVVLIRPGDELKDILRAYTLHRPTARQIRRQAGPEEASIAAVRRLAAWLLRLAEGRGLRPAIERRLTSAGVAMAPGEFLLVGLAAVVVAGLAGLALAHLVGLVVGLALGVLLPLMVLQALSDMRTRKFNVQLVDVLKLLAGSLRAGFSLVQGLDAVTTQVRDPMGLELRRALAASRVVPVEDALAETAERIGSRDFAWAIMAVRIQREVGGNLAEILDTVSETMIQRGRLRREVRTLTAEGRISAVILGVLPVALGLFIWVVNRSYMDQLFRSVGGDVAFIGAIALELVGIFWMYRIVQIEI